MVRRIVAIVAVLGVAGAGAWLWSEGGWWTGSREDGPLVLYGNVDVRDVALGFRVPGRLETLHFEEGDAVEIGAVMAELDRRPYLDELALRGAELAEAEAALRRAEKAFRRREELARSGTVSQSAYDDALAARDGARARAATARARLEVARTALDDAKLLAPDDGTVLTRVREPGAIVGPGAPVCVLALTDPVWVRAYVAEPDLGRVRPGQAATVRTDGGGSHSGQVGFISPQAEFTPRSVETTQLRTDLVYRLRVVVPNPDDGLRQGMPVTVELEEGAAE